MSLTHTSGVEGEGSSLKKSPSWISTKTSERSVAQNAYASDPKYKKYIQQVEKCLNSFDNVHEWADCIAFLKQLLKTFQTYMQFKEIPKKLIVAKRLAQCLNPALPTGVHQRALEVYTHILSVLGLEGLKRDLALWSAGLFPFFEYAATSVKPSLLSIYTTYYVPLQGGLRPIMKSFILALLPGLEEETGEFFEKVVGLLDNLATSVAMSFFFQNIWLVMLTTPAARGTAVNYLSRRLPRVNADEDITEIVGKDIGLMIRAFAAALEDDNLLVRRGTLDLLLQVMKIDSLAIKKAQAEDRAIIMRAAIGVVLRRDISLNRRLYSWLLGPEGGPEDPLGYYKEHALVLLHTTLKNEMFSPSGEYSESRPFKIFISLLDKWEIGGPLADVLIYDAFKAIKHLMEENREGNDDLVMTASTLYEALEPEILWKPLLSALFQEISTEDSKSEALQLALFMVKTFTHDEEIQTHHFPVLVSSLLDCISLQLDAHPSWSTTQPIIACLVLLEELLKYTPPLGLSERPPIKPPNVTKEEARSGSRAYTFACAFYEIEDAPAASDTQSSTLIPFTSSLESLCSLSTRWAKCLGTRINAPESIREAFSRALTLFEHLLTRLSTPLSLQWKPSEWMNTLLETFESESATFTTVDRVVTLITALHRNEHLQPALSIQRRSTIQKMVTKLLKYLRADFVPYHARAVNLICGIETATRLCHVESVIAQTMTSPESRNVAEAYEAFGILWRLTDDTFLPGFRFKVPLMCVLETLKSSDPELYRVGETWMRSSLKSYLRLLDPILHDLLDPAVLRTAHTFNVKKREIAGYFYERPFDQRIMNHLIELLLSIVSFAGQGFSKAAMSSSIRRSLHPGLVQRVESMGLSDANRSYMDVLTEALLRIIESEPKDQLAATMGPLNRLLQSNAIQLLQMIVARGDVDQVSVAALESIIVKKLYFAVHTESIDLQNKLLHLLHSITSLSMVNIENARRAALAAREAQPEGSAFPDQALEELPGYNLNPLLVQTLIDGISLPSNRPVIQHWLDFVLMAVPQFQPALQAAIVPLNECLCRQLRTTLKQIKSMGDPGQGYHGDMLTLPSELDLIILTNGLERLVLLGLAYTAEESAGDDDTTMQEKQAESTGLLGYVSTVFSGDGSSSAVPNLSVARSSVGYRSLDEGISVLYTIWASLIWKPPSTWSPKDESLAQIYSRSRARCRRALEHLFRMQSAEVFESIIDWWNKDISLQESSPDAAFELIDVLVATAQNAVHMVCESIASRISLAARKASNAPGLTDVALFQFLEQYLSKLEGPVAVQVWPRVLQLVRDLTTGSREFKVHHFHALKCLSVVADKVTQTTAMEDRRVRKDLQENYGKLLDLCVAYVGRSSDQGSWIRRATVKDGATNGKDSPLPRIDPKATVDEKMDMSGSLTLDNAKGESVELLTQVTSFVAASVLPNLRRFLLENDKVISACSNIVYYVVNPALRGKTRPMDVEPTVISSISEMTKIPTAIKAWRTPVVDLLNDNRVFNSDPVDGTRWKPIVKALYDADKAAFAELVGKVGSAPSANIFTNKEYEMLLRSLNIRRLSYVLLSGEKNTFLAQLPTIQEKLVDVLKNVTSPVVQSEVFLCIRVLLCRLSPHNLTSFWPVILTELYRILEQIMTTLPPDSSEDLQLVLAACKCIDLLLVLQTQEFQVYQWMFITDTVDAVYRPEEEWLPEAMLDQLAEIAGSLPMDAHHDSDSSHHLSDTQNQTPMRRPLLNGLRQIDSIKELVPFFSNVSISSFESMYASGGNVDWDAVEQGLMRDMFDGR
ncbi:Dopey, N-terminal-domain-containing protein [Coprinopsis sp. MPI-PUGE-AT-0042]|nr:Dopey, N-terminal-domain-containing protein [Coprinopsis sp. MPI-PUGE-AT-0042]